LYEKIDFFILISLLAVNLYSQTETFQIAPKNTISLHLAPYYNDIFSVGHRSERWLLYSLKIDYSRELTDRWSFCTGLDQIALLRKTKDRELYVNKMKDRYIGVPVVLKYSFSNPVFIKFGPCFDFLQLHKTNIEELNSRRNDFWFGFLLSVGWVHEINNVVTLSISHDIRLISDLSWSKINSQRDYFKNISPLFGVNFGIGYKF